MLNAVLVFIGSYPGGQSTFMAEENVAAIRLNMMVNNDIEEYKCFLFLFVFVS